MPVSSPPHFSLVTGYHRHTEYIVLFFSFLRILPHSLTDHSLLFFCLISIHLPFSSQPSGHLSDEMVFSLFHKTRHKQAIRPKPRCSRACSVVQVQPIHDFLFSVRKVALAEIANTNKNNARTGAKPTLITCNRCRVPTCYLPATYLLLLASSIYHKY